MNYALFVGKPIRNEKGVVTDYKIIKVNQAYENMIPLKKEGIIGQRASSIFGDEGETYSYIENVLEKNQKMTKTNYFDRIDKYIEVEMIPLRNDYFACILNDITKEKRAQKSLRKSEAKFKKLIQSAPVGFFVTNLKGKIIFVNEAAQEMLEAEDESELLGKKLIELVSEGSKSIANLRRSKVLEKNIELSPIELKLKTLRSNIIDIIGQGGLIEYEGKNALQVMFYDITEHKTNEEELQRKTDLIKSTFHSSPNAIIVLDSERKIINCNKATLRVFAQDSKDILLEKDIDFFLTQDQLEKAEHDFQIINQRGYIRNQRYKLKALKEKNKILDISGSVLRGPQGRKFGYVLILIDVSDQVKLQEALFKTQKLESLGVLAGGIAHDFNNLMMGILGNAELAMMDLKKNLDISELREYLQDIKQGAKTAASVSKQMLTYSGKGYIECDEIHINELLQGIMGLLKVSISNKISLNLDLEENLPKFIGDETQIKQVIINLVTNASDALKQKPGEIKIKTAKTTLSSEETNEFNYMFHEMGKNERKEFVCLEVIDNGMGMDERTIKKIFDPFFSTKFTGRGLGLASVLGILRRHNGAIKVNSTEGVGTCFEILFPSIHKKQHSSQLPRDKEMSKIYKNGKEKRKLLHNKTILIIDDDKNLLKVVKKMGEKLGAEVLVADRGKKGVELYETHLDKIDLIILDLTMPVMDGEQTLMALKKVNGGVSIILSSGYSKEKLGETILNSSNLNGFLQKPYSLSEFKEALKEVFLKS